MANSKTTLKVAAICMAAMACGAVAQARENRMTTLEAEAYAASAQIGTACVSAAAKERIAGQGSGIVAEILKGETRNLQFGPHKWRVLEVRGDKALIITEDIVGKRQYHGAVEDMVVYGINSYGGVDKLSWATCDLRRFLNTAFLKKFSKEEKKLIVEFAMQKPRGGQENEVGGYATKEKVILLSITEATAYFSSDSDRATGSWWWLRTPGRNINSTATVLDNGAIGPLGETVRSGFGGVRPALWLDLKQ
jgi:hypothetical protein